MAAGAVGRPGAPAQEVKGQDPDSATTQPPAEGASTVWDCRWSTSLVRTRSCST